MAAAPGEEAPPVPAGVDPVFYALHKLRRREFDDCANLCTGALSSNPYDQVCAPWRYVGETPALHAALPPPSLPGGMVSQDAVHDRENVD